MMTLHPTKDVMKSENGQDAKEPFSGMGNGSYSYALQDGLEPEYMKLTEIIRNYKKLNTNKLHKRIER